MDEIVLIVDRSGSMSSCLSDAEGGVNHFITENGKNPDGCFSLVDFDTEYRRVQWGMPLKDIQSYKLEPRGGTALYDAIGKTITDLGDRLKNMPEPRPSKVIVAVMTDGEENSSKEYTFKKIRGMIDHQRDVYKWQFVFMSSDLKAAQVGAGLVGRGFAAGMSVNNTAQAYDTLTANVASYRSTGLADNLTFTDDQRKTLTKPK